MWLYLILAYIAIPNQIIGAFFDPVKVLSALFVFISSPPFEVYCWTGVMGEQVSHGV